MKNIKKVLVIAAASALTFGTVVSCTQGFEELNENPNNPESPLTYGVFNYANRVVTDGTRNSFESARVTLPWMQYSAQTAYNDEDKYAYRSTSGDAIWRQLNIAASNYKKIIDMNSDPETAPGASAYGSNANQIAASRVMLSYVYLNLADTFGDIPYYSYGNSDPDFQALNVNQFIKPKFASQEKVYTDILKELKEASEMIEMNEPVFVPADGLFGGDPAKLKKFANSLRLRVATRVKSAVPSAQAHITDAIASGVMTSNADNVGVKYEANLTNPSPMYNDFRTRSDFSVSKTLIDLLKGNTGNFGLDPRLFRYAAPNDVSKASILNGSYADTTDPSKFIGMPYGLPEDFQASQAAVGNNFFSKYVYRTDYTEILMEYSEVEFLLSEANGWNQTNYQNGVKASMLKWGVTAAVADAFVATLPPASAATVLTQKYVALFMQPQEAWAEYRRTGYPDTSILILPGETAPLLVPIPVTGETTYTFTPLVTGLTDIPARMLYPTLIQTLNPENYASASAAIGGDKMNTKLIWDN
ncbi:SusD/RagB family nutrient-binding outer membrane lipoprotein [Chryseobacterium sp. cx-311]|uniref:SusD/RagB family nutrient-binding outer membrane lipoprotein n=1 Tax=Marnyiella aurantia TaxID=2758037 RepID=UPI001AE1AA58|nr:SusD/RagB family nutrient-binding outer membrane lipoprotein [Marnyiella aurantia]MBP0612700.1 SusD/RagB family nutrient-binding outer membrane lipoprotein [Marnyiella aurantia]